MIFFLGAVAVISVVATAVWIITQRKKKEAEDIERDNKTDKIDTGVQKDEQVTHEIGIPEFIGNLYNDYIKNISIWMSADKGNLSSLITDVVDLGKEYDGTDIKVKTKITLKGKEYIFFFKEHYINMIDGNCQLRGKLELFLNENKLLDLTMARDEAKEDSRWKPICIEMFIEGDWIEDFQEIERSLEQDKQKAQDKNSQNNYREGAGREYS